MSKRKDPEGGELPFEKAIARVEELVAQMEGDRLPLDDLIRYYEEGTGLLKVCRLRLDEAQQKIELITRQSGGETGLEPFDADRAPAAESGSPRSRARAKSLSETDDEIPF